MAGFSLAAAGDNALGSVQRMTGPQRVTLGLAFIATALGVFLVARGTSSTPMSTLYADLDPSVAAEVTAALDAQGIPYQLDGGGRIVQVPSAQLDQARLDLAGQSLPGTSDGWGVFEESAGVTATVFEQRVAYQRAMEGELARTIASIDAVRSATVHLAMPEQDLFADDGIRTSASVLVDTGGGSLTAMQVQSIVNLVATAVEGLDPDQITVTDETGRLHHGPDSSTSIEAMNDTQMRAKFELEAAMERDLEDMLANLVGPGLAFAEVNIELDHDLSSTTTENHVPVEDADGEQVFRDRTIRSEYFKEQPVEEGGELYIELPDQIDVDNDGLVDETVRYYLDERDEQFLYNTVVTTTDNAPGEITRLSVAVGIDSEQIDAASLGDLENLVGAAVGASQERGDNVQVTAIPISDAVKEALAAEAEAATLEPAGGLDLVALIRTIGTVVVALVVLVLALRFLARGPRREVIESIELGAGGAELEAGTDGAPALTAGEEEDSDPPEVRLGHLIENQTDEVAGLLRNWLSETDAGAEGEVVAR